MVRILSAAGLLFVCAAACGDVTEPAFVEVAGLDVTAPFDTLRAIGDSVRLRAVPRASDGEPLAAAAVTWRSANPSAVAVSGTGVATAVGEGTARIFASAGAVAGAVDITVRQAVVRIEVHLPQTSLLEADSLLARAVPRDANGFHIPDRTATWSVSEPALATVAPSGRVVGARAGTVVLSATVDSMRGDTTLVIDDGFLLNDLSAAAFFGHFCGPSLDGVGWCWLQFFDPAQAPGAQRFRHLSPGDGHFCGLALDSAAYCWGSNNHAELGGGVGASWVDTLVPVGGGMRFRRIRANGHGAVCAIGLDDTPYCWGHNDRGQLGRGFQSRLEPTVARPTGSFLAREIAYNVFHGCVIATDDVTYCWGDVTGNAQVSRSDSVVPISGGHRFVSITSYFDGTCALEADGRAWCWGLNWDGQTGTGDTASWVDVPRPVSGALRFRTLTGGWDHVCGFTVDDRVFCWGRGANGELGVPTDSVTRVPVEAELGLPLRQLAAGYQATCGLTPLHSVFCWGRGSHVPRRVLHAPGSPAHPASRVSVPPTRVFPGHRGRVP